MCSQRSVKIYFLNKFKEKTQPAFEIQPVLRLSAFRMLRTVALRSVRAVAIPTKPAYRDLDPETRELYKKIIRVDHAGERGADVIYNGQYDVLKNTDAGPKIKEMWEQEKEHLAAFEKLLVTHRTAPTVLLPLWDILG